MPTADERIKELENLIAEWTRELNVLRGQGGKLSDFFKTAKLPDGMSQTAAAEVIDVWEKYKANQAVAGSLKS